MSYGRSLWCMSTKLSRSVYPAKGPVSMKAIWNNEVIAESNETIVVEVTGPVSVLGKAMQGTTALK